MHSKPNWRQLIRERATSGGIDLPVATIDELALHLEDLDNAARADGANHVAALERAQAALDESRFSALQRHAVRAMVPETTGLNVAGALRVAFRQFRQHPTFALVVVLVLGIGTGAATTVFTAVDAVVLRPLPFAAPDRLVTLWDTNTEKGLAHDPISPVNFMDYRALPVFSDAAAWWRPGVNLVDPGLDPVRVKTVEVSGNVFDVLGVRPQVGAGFPVNGPFFVQNELVAVISDRLWRTRYSGDPSVIGKQLLLNDTPYTVVGVMPAKFHYPDDIDVWQRLRWDLTQHSRAAHFMEAVARMKDGVAFDEAQSAVAALGLRLQNDFRNTNTGWSSRLVPLLDEQLGYYRPALIVMFGAVGLLLLIGLLNVASLLLTRALSRDREIAVRMAMGAAPRQLIAQLLAESLVLSVAGAIVGVIAAAVTLPLVLGVTPIAIPRLDEAHINVRALGLAAAVVIVSTLLFGLIPALLLLKRQLSTDLKSGERGSSRGARAVYSVLVAGEVALACALLVSSALLVRTVGSMMQTPTGVNASDVVTTTVQLAGGGYPSWTNVGRYARAHPRGHSPAARRAVRRGQQFPAARGRLAQSHSADRRAAAGPARGRAAGAAAQRERRLLRVDGGNAFVGAGVHRLRRRRRRAGGDRQRVVRAALPAELTSSRALHRHERDGNRTARVEPDAAASAGAARSAAGACSADTIRDRGRGAGCSQRAARPGHRAGRLLLHEPVPIP